MQCSFLEILHSRVNEDDTPDLFSTKQRPPLKHIDGHCCGLSESIASAQVGFSTPLSRKNYHEKRPIGYAGQPLWALHFCRSRTYHYFLSIKKLTCSASWKVDLQGLYSHSKLLRNFFFKIMIFQMVRISKKQPTQIFQ